MPPIHRSDGTPTGALLGFCNMLNRLVLDRLVTGSSPRLALVFDAPGKNFRHDMFPEYKAHRPMCPIDLVPQFPLVVAAARAYGIPTFEAVGYEADDVIATLATLASKADVDVAICSSDKDLLQLIKSGGRGGGRAAESEGLGASVCVLDPMKGLQVGRDDVVARWGVGPERLGDVLALMGDKADNVPGIRGVGPKTAAELINEYGDLENLLEKAGDIKQQRRRELIMDGKELARISRRLVELERNVPLELIKGLSNTEVKDIRMEPLNEGRLLSFFKEVGFGEMTRRVSGRFAEARSAPPREAAESGAEDQFDNVIKKNKSATNPRPRAQKEEKSAAPESERLEDVPF